MEWKGKWIGPAQSMGDVCPVFVREFNKGDFPGKEIKSVQLQVTALGVYEAQLNGKRVGDYVLAPGWTSYETRHQYQCYDITELVEDRNRLEITVGKGWYRSPVPGWITEEGKAQRAAIPAGLIAEIKITFTDTTTAVIPTDETWQAAESRIRFSEIYDGEVYDASFEVSDYQPVVLLERTTDNLIPQQGEKITEHEYVKAARCFTAPNGEVVVDFGQEVTGYIQFTVDAKAGEKVEISHGEVLDKDGNFYNANYRSAKSKIYYTCCDGAQTYKPKMTFFGFRYIRLDQFPGTPCADQFYAVAVHSDMKRTGRLRSSNPLLNQLFSNIIWGQKGNFLDVPTDCPQRDERMGWTGDAQAFVKTASYNFDVDRFFTKWLADMAADQRPDGSIGHVVPTLYVGSGSAAWDDAAAICPWQIYMTYGDKEILRQQFDCMKKYIGFITNSTKDPYLWTGGEHYEDWLGLDAPVGSYKGSSRADFIASAFYAYSTSLVVKAGRVLGEDVSEYERLYQGIVDTFRKTFTDYRTQTEHVLAVHFGLAEDPQKTADALAEMIKACGSKLQTGFVGTPYLLHVLSGYGHTELAYTLLLRTEYPSWLYPVTKGATTVWEHWDGIMENGDFWSTDMNSFNHYAYGAVADWVYEAAAGIQTVEDAPGFARVKIAPQPDSRLDWLEASIETRKGTVRSLWKQEEGRIRYEITTPSPAEIVIAGKTMEVEAGDYIFYSEIA
ncbi:alpha-L-rhamnosidase [Eisenbergiella porci]|uniref:alpha-L-rhamnosidase n=1 Tax=Eisenbergiella porci TaxID=2652274 RepID=UPI002A806F1E|nr:family 78 glycoside hydrolase catalytic domain [Eisenbergiella porci]